ncbi:Paraquat-inducible protein B [Pasteurella testudinis DSM 23072]|uniref:Paraquat-inducible protein B n=1 Tax=Pasteurella testudinis DSM 23072 TaxID=1122938 RepID=A0A1W1V9S4_9PAST|nr:MlaD family protein [Pasteurella testudinis]SMB90088.1 Paraquat-inducible protein B [Pasteurella testudinis DSM 23072]SUB51329.1 mammalian cell entry-like protein [Pasteurella testudinis]
MTNNVTNPQNNQPQKTDHNAPPKVQNATVRRLKSISPFWLLPIVALIIGLTLFARILDEQGESITIYFTNGAGITADKTPIRYQGLQIGVVRKVKFTEDLKQIMVTASINPEAKTVLRENTRFWLVQPSASLAGISGLDALVSGNYITLAPGDGDSADEFIAESEGPMAQMDEGDILIHLLADNLGSISAGASVNYRKIPVGSISDYRFLEDKKKVEIDVVINKSYSHLVKKDSRFWNSSGLQTDISLSGISVDMDSLTSLVIGGVSFDSPDDSQSAVSGDSYTLYQDEKSAQRGIEIDITLPNIRGLRINSTPLYYENFKIGTLSALDANVESEVKNTVRGKLLVNENMRNLLRSGSQIVINENSLNSDNLNNLEKLLAGPYFNLVAGDGELQTEFTVLTQSELLLSLPDTLVIRLTAPETYNVNVGQGIFYNGIRIGEIAKRTVSVDGVEFQIAIAEEYRHLIYADTKFIAASNLNVNIGVDGIQFEAASPEKWLQGGIRILANKQGAKKSGNAKPLAQYPLYKDIGSAEAGITGDNLQPTIVLSSPVLPGIENGSLVLYKQYPVGQIIAVRPTDKDFQIDVFINSQYRNLLTDRSKFWSESAAQVDIGPKGVSIQAAPIMRTLKGAISFENFGAANKNTRLYNNETAARSVGNEITLTSSDAKDLSRGMPIRYMGITIGEVVSIEIDKNNQRIVSKALIQPNYYGLISKKGSSFRLVSPQISAGAIENLDSLLQPYIDVNVGNGETAKTFRLIKEISNAAKFANGLPLVLETSSAFNLTEGSPVQYRGIEVGLVQRMRLNELGDRVLVDILIGDKYKHLVRQNSEFWITSGYSFGFGLQGFAFETGSVQQFLKGGITFGTPSGQIVQPAAKARQRFLLQQKLPEDSKFWNQGAY